jgi:excisionase family DNA binding protein
MNEIINDCPMIMNIPDAAKILGVHPNTIRSLIKSKSLRAVRVGKRYKITKNSLLHYLGDTEAN